MNDLFGDDNDIFGEDDDETEEDVFRLDEVDEIKELPASYAQKGVVKMIAIMRNGRKILFQ